MKANEFVKKYGWDEAKELIAKHEECYLPDVFDMWSDKLQDFVLCTKYASFNISDLKRLVESYELVEKHQGLNGAKNVLKLLEESLDIGLYHGIDGIDATTEVPKIKQAIAEVESCEVKYD